jgi:hypothetical protein
MNKEGRNPAGFPPFFFVAAQKLLARRRNFAALSADQQIGA